MKNEITEESWVPAKPEVPESWCVCDFEKAFKPVSANKKKIKTKAYQKEGNYPIIDQSEKFISGFTDKKESLIEGSNGLVIFGDHTRRFKFVDFDFAPGADGIKVLTPIYHDPKCAFYLCCAIGLPNKGYSRHYSFLKKTYIPLPPIAEQKRIVNRIDELFGTIEKGEAEIRRINTLIKNYNASEIFRDVASGPLRQSILRSAFLGKLVLQNPDDEPSAELIKRIDEERTKAKSKRIK